MEFSPSGNEFKGLNKKLEQYKYVADGYGWADYILAKLKEDRTVFEDEVSCDSEAETCVLENELRK